MALKIVPLNTPIPWEATSVCTAEGPDVGESARFALCPSVTPAQFRLEVANATAAAARGIGPMVHKAWACRGTSGFSDTVRGSGGVDFGLLLSERVPGVTLRDYSRRFGWTRGLDAALLRLFCEVDAAGYTYPDLHGDNVLIQYRKAPRGPRVTGARLVDFASLVPRDPQQTTAAQHKLGRKRLAQLRDEVGAE